MPITRRQLLAGTAAIGAAATIGVNRAAATVGELEGTRILITGCSSGFGRLCALHFARLGASVYATMRRTPRSESEELIAIAAEENLDLKVMRLDVLYQNEIDDALASVAADGAPLDVLVNNAGIGITGPIEVQDEEAIKLQFDTNVMGYHRVTRTFLPMLRGNEHGGQIFFVSSQLGRVIAPGAGHYCATKFAVEAMAEQLAYELVPHDIDVTIIQPGGYPTDIWKNRNVYNTALRERAAEVHKAGYPAMVERMGQEDGSGRSADPMDIPRAIARIITMPAGTRPLREAVHPGSKPQLAINKISAETQVGWLGQSGRWGDAVRAVHS